MKKIAQVGFAELLKLLKTRDKIVKQSIGSKELISLDSKIDEEIATIGIFHPKKKVRYNFLLKKLSKTSEEQVELDQLVEERKKILNTNLFSEIISTMKPKSNLLTLKKRVLKRVTAYNETEINYVPDVFSTLIEDTNSLNAMNFPDSIVYSEVSESQNEINKSVRLITLVFISVTFDEIENKYKKYLWKCIFEEVESGKPNEILGEFSDIVDLI